MSDERCETCGGAMELLCAAEPDDPASWISCRRNTNPGLTCGNAAIQADRDAVLEASAKEVEDGCPTFADAAPCFGCTLAAERARSLKSTEQRKERER